VVGVVHRHQNNPFHFFFAVAVVEIGGGIGEVDCVVLLEVSESGGVDRCWRSLVGVYPIEENDGGAGFNAGVIEEV
jgi:hypothetical protein